MFQFRRFPSYTYLIQYMMTEVCSVGLLHSEICGSMCTYHSPQLIAVNHVLRRLPMPRHSPCALFSFTILLHVLEFSKKWLFLNTCSFLPDKINLIVFTRSILICITFALFSFQVSFLSVPKNRFQQQVSLLLKSILSGGHKWTRTIDLTLIRRAL